MTRSPKAIIIGKKLGYYYDTKVIACKERQTLYAIMEAFRGLSMKYQYAVYPYRIDLYFLDYKIAVECDENGHKDYDQKSEKERQQFLEDSLGCQFVRYNPDGQGFSIFKVINKIFTKVQKAEL